MEREILGGVVVKKRSITFKGVLEFLDDEMELWFPMDRKSVYQRFMAGKVGKSSKRLEDYFPSIVLRAAAKLERKGLVEKIETEDGLMVRITDKGRREILKFRLGEMKVKKGRWDGMWRLVFFDIAETSRRKRGELRKYLRQLGLKQMQESVWVTPWEIRDEIKYLREVLDIPHAVKWGLLSEIENAEDLKEWFEI